VTVDGKVSQLSGSCPALTFMVENDSVRTTADTVFAGDACKKIKKGTKVTVRGVRQAGGQILASRVEQDDHGGDDDGDHH
jgi:Domain of unknown function (DUF5666)